MLFRSGPGLDNFCACGGCYGYSCCFGWYNGRMGCGWYNIQCKWSGKSWNRWQSDHGPDSQEERDAKKEDNISSDSCVRILSFISTK